MTKRLNSKFKVDRRLKVNFGEGPRVLLTQEPMDPNLVRPKLQNHQIWNSKSKTKLKAYYGNINERQFRNIYKKASMLKGDTSENLIGLLERRLDAVIYKAKFATTIFSKIDN